MTKPLSRWLVLTRPVVAGFHLAGDTGANLEARNRYGITPMMAAAWFIRYDIVHELLQAGADPKAAMGPNGKTLLDEIPEGRIDPKSDLYQWREKVIELLRSRGFDVGKPATEKSPTSRQSQRRDRSRLVLTSRSRSEGIEVTSNPARVAPDPGVAHL